MPRDVAPRTLPADPTEDMHAATKQYVDNQIGGGAWPVEIDADGYATILYVVGTMKIGVWYGAGAGGQRRRLGGHCDDRRWGDLLCRVAVDVVLGA
jgi:hypothetical protein